MKDYQSRHELKKDVKFIKSIVIDKEYCNYLINILFDAWMKTSPDSPWYTGGGEGEGEGEYSFEEEDVEVANLLVKISGEGKSNEWEGEHTVFESVQKNSRSKYYNLRNL